MPSPQPAPSASPPIPTPPRVPPGGQGFTDFQSPSGNIGCSLGEFNGKGTVVCEIGEHDYPPPPNSPPGCQADYRYRFILNQGYPPNADCTPYPIITGAMPTLDYGHQQSVDGITCDSEPSGVTCRDATSGNYFHIERERYDWSR